MIQIFPNKLSETPFEVHHVDRRTSIADWLNGVRKEGFRQGDNLPLSVTVNGEVIDQDEWWSFVFKPSDAVNFFIEPRGTDPFSITVALFAGVKAVFGMLMPKLPGTPSAPGQGDALSEGSARGNKVKLGDVIRESFGTQRIYPDYLLPTHKYFSDWRTQWMEILLCVGKGRYDIQAGNVRIGETSLLALGDEASYQIFQPGESVIGHPSATWWHSAPEVGSSSTGAAGLELTATTSLTPNVQASALQFSGYTVTIPSGAGSFPSDWTAGLTVRIVAPYGYTITDGGGSARDVVSGPLNMLNPTVGNTIEVAGPNAGIYTVNSYTPGTPGQMTLDYQWGAPANQLITGTALASIGPVGLLYRITSITPSTISVDRLTSSGSVDSTFPGFNAATMSNASISLDSRSVEGGWRGPFPGCPENEKSNTLEFDLFFPEGLCGIGQEGNIYSTVVEIEVQWRDMAVGGAWTSVIYSFTNNTLDQIGISELLILPYPMRAELRMRKKSPLTENLELHNTTQWYGLRMRLNAPAKYDDCTVLAVRVQVSDRIAAQTESQIYVIATRILPTRSGGVWQPVSATRDIVPAFCYIAKNIGYTDSDLDLVELDRLDAVWKSRGDKFDTAITSESTAKQVLNDALGAGFAELTLDRGVITPVRDEPRGTFEHMYTPQNMTQQLTRDVQLYSPDDFDGVDVTYQSAVSWAEETIECRLPGSDGRKVEKINAVGVTDATRAWRIGMRRLRTHRYRRDSFSWSTELDALNSRYMSYCMVSDDVPGYGQSSLLMSYVVHESTIDLESSEPLDWSAPGPHYVAIRKPDGRVSGPYLATRIPGDDYGISVGAIDFTPDTSWQIEPPHLLFGPASRYSYPVLITDISPNGSAAASVEAIGYNPLVYADDDNSPT